MILAITDEKITTARIGFVSHCTALLPPGEHGSFKVPPREQNSEVVRVECGAPTTHVRAQRFADATTRWRSVCLRHTVEPLA